MSTLHLPRRTTPRELSDGPCSVIAIRDDGRRVLYSHEPSRAAAEATVAALAGINLPAEVATDIDPDMRPGTRIPDCGARNGARPIA